MRDDETGRQEEAQRRLSEIQALRRLGLITQQEAYERHLRALQALAAPPETATPPPPGPAAPPSGDERLALDVLAVAVALLGGALGVVGAFVQELQQAGLGILIAFVAAPLIEEALKPAGVYVLLARWPRALRGQTHTAVLTALAGLVFGLIEAFVYVSLYYPEGGADYVLFRFTVPVTMHTLASFVVGMGLDRGVIDWAAGRAPLPKQARDFFIAGVALHALYNIAAVALSFAGVFDFEQGT